MLGWNELSEKGVLDAGELFLLSRYVTATKQTYLVGLLAI